jgi:hypothetical protein
MRFRFLILLFVFPLLAACNVFNVVPTAPLQIEPAHKAPAVSPKFTQSYYYVDRDQTLYFILRSTVTDAGKPIEQILTARVFWQPKGGVTTMNPAALNATFRYAVITPEALGLYEGAGFVRLDSKPGDARFRARVIDADIRLTQASSAFTDTLGRAHVKGGFSAVYDDAKAMDMLLEAQQAFFARSLKGPATQTQPATSSQPATRPAPPPTTVPATVPASRATP